MATRSKKSNLDPEQVAAEGYYAAAASDDNSVAVGEEGYVGVSPEYQNYANEHDKPLFSEDKEVAAVEKAAKQDEVDRAESAGKIGHLGYEVDTPHPSEAVNPATEHIDLNRAALNKLAGVDEESKSSDSGSSKSGSGISS